MAKSLHATFSSNSFANIVDILTTFESFLYHDSIECYDIVLVDISLWSKRNRQGIDILKRIRKGNIRIPVIVMSSYSEYSSLQEAFTCWANDYIIKPFRNKELQIRIERWFHNYLFTEYYSINKSINYNNVSYCLSQNEFFLNERKINLSKSSKYIFLLFLIHKESLLTSEYLIRKIWGYKENENLNLRIKIMRLKKQLKIYGLDSLICTIHWEGYMLIKK